MQEPAVFRKRNRQVCIVGQMIDYGMPNDPRQMPVMPRTYEDDRNYKYVL